MMKRSVISNKATFEAEDRHLERFVIKQSISIERCGTVYICDEEWNDTSISLQEGESPALAMPTRPLPRTICIMRGR